MAKVSIIFRDTPGGGHTVTLKATPALPGPAAAVRTLTPAQYMALQIMGAIAGDSPVGNVSDILLDGATAPGGSSSLQAED